MPKLPLKGIVVIDFATLIAAPNIATFLGDFGATVFKVELPEIGDPMRSRLAYPDGRSPIWLNEGRNKKTSTLNLRTKEGQQIAHKFAEKADVVLLNFRPGQAEKWNLAADDFHKTNRIKNQDALYGIIEQWVKNLTAEQGLKICDDAGVPADIIRNIADLAQDDHMRQRQAIMEFDDPEKGKILLPGVFPKMVKFPGRVKFLGAKLGEYNQEIYGDFLGLP